MLFSFENLYLQYLACRRNKRNTLNALEFEARQEENLLALREALVARTYAPSRSVCFFAPGPKLREIFAADFRDRVAHHVLVSHLERIWEPLFIHDSYACRRGRGVHAAVQRLRSVLLFQVGRFFEFYERRDEPVSEWSLRGSVTSSIIF